MCSQPAADDAAAWYGAAKLPGLYCTCLENSNVARSKLKHDMHLQLSGLLSVVVAVVTDKMLKAAVLRGYLQPGWKVQIEGSI